MRLYRINPKILSKRVHEAQIILYRIDLASGKEGCSGPSPPLLYLLGGGGRKRPFRALFIAENWPRHAGELLQVLQPTKRTFQGICARTAKCSCCQWRRSCKSYACKCSHYTMMLLEKRCVSRKQAKDTSSGIVSHHTVNSLCVL